MVKRLGYAGLLTVLAGAIAFGLAANVGLLSGGAEPARAVAVEPETVDVTNDAWWQRVTMGPAVEEVYVQEWEEEEWEDEDDDDHDEHEDDDDDTDHEEHEDDD